MFKELLYVFMCLKSYHVVVAREKQDMEEAWSALRHDISWNKNMRIATTNSFKVKARIYS